MEDNLNEITQETPPLPQTLRTRFDEEFASLFIFGKVSILFSVRFAWIKKTGEIMRCKGGAP